MPLLIALHGLGSQYNLVDARTLVKAELLEIGLRMSTTLKMMGKVTRACSICWTRNCAP
jgi:hypothetical protein